MVLLGLIIGGLAVFVCMSEFVTWVFMLVILVEGFAMGGVLNMFVSNMVYELANGDSKRVDMLSTYSGILSFVMSGLVNFLVGVSVGSADSETQTSNVYAKVF